MADGNGKLNRKSRECKPRIVYYMRVMPGTLVPFLSGDTQYISRESGVDA